MNKHPPVIVQAIVIVLIATLLALLHYLSGYGQDLHLPAVGKAAAPVPCLCGGDLYSCTDFGSQHEAQRCYDRCMVLGLGDIHNISNGSGWACVVLQATIVPTPAITPTPAPTATPLTSCDCSYDRYNCDNFERWADAQGCFLYCYGEYGDIHNLDADHGGIPGVACEDRPGRPAFCPIP